jgi:hypothetical protein
MHTLSCRKHLASFPLYCTALSCARLAVAQLQQLKPVIEQLEADGIIKIIKETYIPKWYRDDDKTVFILEKLRPLLSQ